MAIYNKTQHFRLMSKFIEQSPDPCPYESSAMTMLITTILQYCDKVFRIIHPSQSYSLYVQKDTRIKYLRNLPDQSVPWSWQLSK